MSIFRQFIKWYFYITTGILVIVAANFALYGVKTIPRDTLWQILLSGFITTLVTILLAPRANQSRVKEKIGMLIHYLGLCAAMIISGSWFGWIRLNQAGIRLMMISVALVYIIVYGVDYLLNRKQADEINQKLQEKYPDNLD